MKSSELHKLIRKNGWNFVRAQGTSHYIYEKNGELYTVPFHAAKEAGKGTESKTIKKMGLKK